MQTEIAVIAVLCSWVWGHYIRLICGRLEKAHECSCPRWLLNQPRIYRHYWRVAPHHDWSRAPVLVATCAFLVSIALTVLVLMPLVLRFSLLLLTLGGCFFCSTAVGNCGSGVSRDAVNELKVRVLGPTEHISGNARAHQTVVGGPPCQSCPGSALD